MKPNKGYVPYIKNECWFYKHKKGYRGITWISAGYCDMCLKQKNCMYYREYLRELNLIKTIRKVKKVKKVRKAGKAGKHESV